jgi:signal transduction histidine kinase
VDADWERPPPTSRQQLRDVGVGLLLVIGAICSLVLTRSAGADLDGARAGQGEEIAWALAIGLPLCLRRRYPLAVLLAVSIAFIGLQSRQVGESTVSSICLFLALYTAGAWGRDRRITFAVRIVVIVVMFCWLAYVLSSTAWSEANAPEPDDEGGPLPVQTAVAIYTTAVNVLYFAAAWVFGNADWAQTKQRAELAERNRELQVERDANARRAVIAERVRIARELHDVVAHHVSVMGVQAGAARRVLERDPALAERTLSSIESAGRSAVEEMHRLLGVLREGDPVDEDEDRAPAPGLDQLEALISQARNAGPEASFGVVGEPRPVPQSISVSLYRITQEALTNTVRHAGASRVDVRLRYLEAGVEVEVVDNGRGRAATGKPGNSTGSKLGTSTGSELRNGTGNTATNQDDRASGSGMGHVGMRERVAMHDGQLEVGPRPEGGFRVRARFPIA